MITTTSGEAPAKGTRSKKPRGRARQTRRAAPGTRAPTHSRKEEQQTPLQKHAAFFDRNGDGKIALGETYAGCRALGYGRVLSGALAAIINTALGMTASANRWPSLTIDIAKVHRGKHGSDTDVYDEQGQFVPAKFDEMFARFDRDGDGKLSVAELWERARSQRDLLDVVGQVTSLAEFALTFVIAAERGKLSRETLRRVYDGSLFYAIEAQRRRDNAAS